ncbi:hypothetical protein [Kribbella speibonae]|uniref:hypothetical protein n=1 Tax=Kribbella speibonae TaxID=1572660 RepID=UPI0013F3CA98|nr:hypothetical protein [Kribbella speibonae]
MVGETDWAAIAGEFSRRELTALTTTLESSNDAFRKIVDRALDDEDVSAEFARAWTAAGRQPGETLLLAAYLYARCQAEWELTGDYDRISAAIDSARRGWEQCDRPEGLDDPATDLFLQHVASLPECMNAEGAVNSSCPVALEDHAAAVAEVNSAILRSIKSTRNLDASSFGRFLSEIVEKHIVTYEAVAAVAHAVLGWLLQGSDAVRALEACMARLEKAESSALLANDVYASELRAHRYALQSLAEHTPGPRMPELTVDEARLIYCYPFAVPPSVNWEDLGEADVLAGARPQLADRLQLSDIWNEKVYNGLVVTLPPINIRTTAGLDLRHTVELRLSNLGNHYIRIEHASGELGLHDIYQGFRRALPIMGEETVTWLEGGDGRSWKRLHEFANGVLEDLAMQVANAKLSEWYADLQKNFHVVLEIRRARVRVAGGDEREATGADITATAGKLLLNPITSYATALEEWTRRQVPEVHNLCGDAGYDTDLLARTDNTTLLVLPGSPNWVYLGEEEKVEFVASLPPLLQRWRQELRDLKDALANPLKARDLEKTKRRQVEEDRMSLARHVAEVRLCLDRLHSQRLVPAGVQRRQVDRLYEAAGLTRYEREIDEEIREVEALYALVAAYVGVVEEHKARDEEHKARAEEQRARAEEVATSKYQGRMQAALGVLAVLSLVGLFDAINQFTQASAADRVPSVWASVELAFVLLTATAIAVGFWLTGRRGGKHGHGV